MYLPASLNAVDDAEKRRGEAGCQENIEKRGHLVVLLSSPLGDGDLVGVSACRFYDLPCQLSGGLEILGLEAPLLDAAVGDEGYAVVCHFVVLLQMSL